MLRSTCLSLLVGLLLVGCGSLGPDNAGGGNPPGTTPPGSGSPGDDQTPTPPAGATVPAQDYAVKVPFGAVPGDAGQKGQWSQEVQWNGILPIHAMLLPDGKVLSFGGNYYPDWQNYAGKKPADIRFENKMDLWDPQTGSHENLSYVGQSLFCGGHVLLANGKLLVAGGDDLSLLARYRSREAGIKETHVYDYRTKKWEKSGNMSQPRWYPTTTTLPSGDVLTVGGNTTLAPGTDLTDPSKTAGGTYATIPEVYSTQSGTWRNLSGINKQIDFYPWLFVASNGKVFHAGPDKDDTGWIDPAGGGTFTPAGVTPAGMTPKRRDYGTAVMYAQDKVLVIGGGGSDERGNLPNQVPGGNVETPSADTIDLDLTGGNVQATRRAPMKYPRRFHTSTLLPDGSVLVTGGTSAYGFNNRTFIDVDPYAKANGLVGQDATVKVPELWNPATKQWSELAPMSRERLYHSIALLLPDATVLVGGSGSCTYNYNKQNGGQGSDAGYNQASGCPENQGDLTDANFKNAQVFKPPYLFKGARPSIASVSTNTLRYNQSFGVTTTGASGPISKVRLIKLGAVTHAFDMEQRLAELPFSQSGNTLNVTAPQNANLATPGYYMLFVLNSQGVPSVARILNLQ